MKNMKLVSSVRAAILLAWCALAQVCAAAGQDEISGPATLEAAYAITFARVSVGAASLHAEFKEKEYAVTATARAGGLVRALLNGSTSLSTYGLLQDGRLLATLFTSKTQAESETQTVRMVLDGGNVKELEVSPAIGGNSPPEEEGQGIIDPLSAMLVPAPGRYGAPWQDTCRRTLPVFDGRYRYDLRLAFKRMDHVSEGQGYNGPVVVCTLTYVPIAGHSGTTPLVKYLSEGREMEIALAPVSGTPVLAPARLFVGGMLGNLIITTTRYETGVPSTGWPAAPEPAQP